MTSRTLTSALALALASPMHAAASTPRPADLNDIRLPPEASRFNELGIEAYRTGDFEAAYRELKRSYEHMDPRVDIDARDMVLASLRSALVKLYEKTGELRHLCLARTELLRHLESLLITFGEDTDLPDIPGIRRRVRQLNEKIADHAPRLGEPTCSGPVQVERAAPPRPSPAPPPTPPPDRGRALLIVGAAGLAVGGVLLGAMTHALLMRRANIEGIKALSEAATLQPGGQHTREQRALADSLADVGGYHRTTAVTTGFYGGALVVAGVAALIVRRVLRGRPRSVAFLPAPQRTGAALFISTRF